MSDSGETFVSWATNITKCSNPIFGRVINKLWSNPQLQKDVLAVLTGVTKLIQSRGGSESPAEYYASLLSLMNTNSSTKTAEAYLLRLVISKAVPAALLRKTFSEASKTLTNVLSAALQEEKIDIQLCKSLLLSLGKLLSAQSSENWATESIRHSFRIFLRFIDHDNPTIRKTCHVILKELLASTLNRENCFHPVCHQTVNHTCSIIRQEKSQLSALIRTNEGTCGRLLHCLNLLKSILSLVPEKDVKTGCECVLELTDFSVPLVVKSAFECLQAVFEGLVKDSSLPIDMAGKLMTALFTCRPRDSTAVDSAMLARDAETLGCWLECLWAGVGHLTTLAIDVPDKGFEVAMNVAAEHLEHLMKVSLSLVVNSPISRLREIAHKVLCGLFANQLSSQLHSGDLLMRRPRLMSDLCLTLQSALNLSRRETWPQLLNLSARLCQIWPAGSTTLTDEVSGLLVHVADIRDALVDGADAIEMGAVASVTDINALIDEMDRLVFTAMEAWGIEAVLRDALPLEPLITELESGSVELRRSWILPLIIRVHPMQPCSLAYFFTNILPLADRAIMVAKAAAAQTFTRSMGGKQRKQGFVPLSAILNAAVSMAHQLWCILTPFTKRAPSQWADLVDSGLGSRLIIGLISSKAVRPVILSALRRLIGFTDTDEAVVVMRAGARKMVPRILSLFEEQENTGDHQLKQQLRTTLSAFFPLLTPKMLSIPCEMAYNKLINTERPIYMEILLLIVPHLETENIKTILKQLDVYFAAENCKCPTLKKPAYRLLEAILSSPSPTAQEFVSVNLDYLVNFMTTISPLHAVGDTLASDLASLSVSEIDKRVIKAMKTPWKARLRILRLLMQALVARMQTEQEKDNCSSALDPRLEAFITSFLPEVPPRLCDLNSLVRVLAGRLLVDMARASAGISTMGYESALRPSAKSISCGRSIISRMSQDEDDDLENDEDDEKMEEDGKSYMSDVASVCTAITTGMDPAIAVQTCAGLQKILSHIWPLIMELPSVKLSELQSNQVKMAAKSVCRLLSDSFLRRALMSTLMSSSDENIKDSSLKTAATSVLSNANLASHALVVRPCRQLAAIGLQISRLLIAFIGRSVFVSDIVISLQSVHESQKHSLRFVVKAIIEKLLKKKISVQALQSLMDVEYHKMIRNSAKIQLRRERKRADVKDESGAGSHDKSKDDDKDSDEEEAASMRSGRADSISGASFKSFTSALSSSKRVHVANIHEILAQSSDEDETRQNASVMDETQDDKVAVPIPRRRQGLAAELESTASVAGLSRRSRKSICGKGDDSSSDDGSSNDYMPPSRRVRFADEQIVTGGGKKRKHVTTGIEPNTFLVEDAEHEVLDLADPDALARHITFAPSAQIAKRAHVDRLTSLLPTGKKRARLTSLSATNTTFPMRDGRYIINDTTSGKRTEQDDWLLTADDDEETGAVLPAHLQSLKSVALAESAARREAVRLPGAAYKSARARGDMKKPGLPDPFAFVPLGAGLSTSLKKGATSKKGGFASDSERRNLLRSLGAGKQKKSPKESKQAASGGSRKRVMASNYKVKTSLKKRSKKC